MKKRTGKRAMFVKHLSQNSLTRLANGEMSGVRLVLAKRHLERCARCHKRYRDAVNTGRMVEEYRRNVMERIGPMSRSRREEFLRKLDIAMSDAPVSPWWKRLPAARLMRSLGNAAPAYTSSVIVLLCGVAVFFAWRGPLVRVSASDLLNRAVAFDAKTLAATSSRVIRRRLRIQSGTSQFERELFRDPLGQRTPKHVKASRTDADLAARLALAGVSWDDPLSALSFKAWHDQQTDAKDQVRRAGSGLLTISTRVGSTNVAAETLTVRQDTFHPVERTIEYRDASFVSISEIGLELVGWDIAKDAFADNTAVGKGPVPSVVSSRTPAVVFPSGTQLNEAELTARLLLGRKNADSGEEITVTRDERGVAVGGLVASAQRRNELNDALRGIPFLTAKIQSFEDLRAMSTATQEAATTSQATALVARVSPLEAFFVAHKRDREELSRISLALFEHALAIQRSSQALEQITARFAGDTELSAAAQAARDELLSLTAKRLAGDLVQENDLLATATLSGDSGGQASRETNSKTQDLTALAKQNMALAKELISGDSEKSRSAQELAAELAETISELRAATLNYMPSRSHQP